MQKIFCFLLLCFICINPLLAAEKVVNIYAWPGEIPSNVIRDFEHETGIAVNISTYDNNEIMYAKIRAMRSPGYDLIMPSSYFVDKMRVQNLLVKLDKSKLSNWKNLNPHFLNTSYDPHANYAMPFIWGVTGIFINSNYYATSAISSWLDLWQDKYFNQLMLLDDSREAFSIALFKLGYSPNDTNPAHIEAAFDALKALQKNIKVFSSDTMVSIMIDEDARLGMGWNGDVFKAAKENPAVKFIYPKDGFIIWVDTMAIPTSAPHPEAAYAFMNYLLRPDVAKEIALYTNFAIANLAGEKLLPKNIRDNKTIYPTEKQLSKGVYQINLDDKTLGLYEKYWEKLKMSG